MSAIAEDDATFRALRPYNNPERQFVAGLRVQIDQRITTDFPGDGMTARLVGALAARKALPIKELAESMEVFERLRRRLRAPHVADLCSGHGLTGLLFALFERKVERVILIDTNPPPSYQKVLAAVVEVGPWVADKVEYITGRVQQATRYLDEGTSIVAVHACGIRTDHSIKAATLLKGHVGVLPCCYNKTGRKAPRGLRERLGVEITTDIQRTYELEAEGYDVRWSAIPRVITPMNRLIIGYRGAARH